MTHINHLEPLKLPVRQNGCVKEASGVKYFSIVARWIEGVDCVREWMTWEISPTGPLVRVCGWGGGKGERKLAWVFHRGRVGHGSLKGFGG